MMRTIPVFILLFLFSACGRKSEEKAEIPEMALAQKSYNSALSSAAATTVITSADGVTQEPSQAPVPGAERRGKKIIRNASLRLQVKEHDASVKAIEQRVKALGGYISNASRHNTSYSIETDMTIRIPANRLDTLLPALTREAVYIDQQQISSEDVTAQYIDTEARLKSKKEVEARYLQLLNQARNVTEVLEVENQLRIIREEIESKEGLLKYYNDQTDYSTISLSVYERVENGLPPETGFFRKSANGIVYGWHLLLDFIIILFNIWPFILLGIIAFYLIVKWKIRNKTRQYSKNPKQTD